MNYTKGRINLVVVLVGILFLFSGGIFILVKKNQKPERLLFQEVYEEKNKEGIEEGQNEEVTKKEEKKEDFKENLYQRQYLPFLKFVSSENGIYFLTDAEIRDLKSLNVNGIRICPPYSILKDKTIKSEVPEEWIVKLIRKAHQEGFAVFLEVNFAGPPNSNEFGGFPHLTEPSFLSKIYDISLKWAKIAEREKVEFFSPLNEPNAVFASLYLVNQWIEKSQNLKKLFSGGLVLKLADIGPEEIGNISKYDYLAFDIMWGNNRYDELKKYLELAVKKGDSFKRKYGLKGFFFGEIGSMRMMVSKDIQAEIFRTVLENTWDRVDGYCFLGWSDLEFKFKDNEEAKDIIRLWYSK